MHQKTDRGRLSVLSIFKSERDSVGRQRLLQNEMQYTPLEYRIWIPLRFSIIWRDRMPMYDGGLSAGPKPKGRVVSALSYKWTTLWCSPDVTICKLGSTWVFVCLGIYNNSSGWFSRQHLAMCILVDSETSAHTCIIATDFNLTRYAPVRTNLSNPWNQENLDYININMIMLVVEDIMYSSSCPRHQLESTFPAPI